MNNLETFRKKKKKKKKTSSELKSLSLSSFQTTWFPPKKPMEYWMYMAEWAVVGENRRGCLVLSHVRMTLGQYPGTLKIGWSQISNIPYKASLLKRGPLETPEKKRRIKSAASSQGEILLETIQTGFQIYEIT